MSRHLVFTILSPFNDLHIRDVLQAKHQHANFRKSYNSLPAMHKTGSYIDK